MDCSPCGVGLYWVILGYIGFGASDSAQTLVDDQGQRTSGKNVEDGSKTKSEKGDVCGADSRVVCVWKAIKYSHVLSADDAEVEK